MPATKTVHAAALFVALLLCVPGHGQFGPQRGGDLDAAVPTPDSVMGHAVGEKAVRYPALVAYMGKLAEASPYVTVTPYATSHEGRRLHYLVITSEANHERLAEILADNARLADPRKLDDPGQADPIIDGMPGIAWLAYNIHGDEMSPGDAAMEVMYRLAAGTDQATRRLRDELVVCIDPLMNPDGRERYLNQLQTLHGKVSTFDYQALPHQGVWSAGRGNHYLFDLNRDWLMLVHPETRGRVAAILEFNPHFLIDSHEMSGLDTYLFDPPREPLNVNFSETGMKWRRKFSEDQAGAFDRNGWSYYTEEWYEEWYPGYTNGWANLLGIVGLLYEAPSLNSGTVRQESGELVTYRDAVERNVVGSFANLETLRVNRREMLRDYFDDRKWAVSGDGDDAEYFVITPTPDQSRLRRLLNVLDRHRIEYSVTEGELEGEEVVSTLGESSDRYVFPAGSVVVPPAQPHRRFMRAMLQFDPHMTESFLREERTDLEKGRGSRIYDVTAWNLPMAYGLTAFTAARIGPLKEGRLPRAAAAAGDATYGYLLDGADSDVYRALVRLFAEGCHPRVASKPFTVGGYAYPRGSVLLRRHENPGELDARVERATAQLNVQVRPVATALTTDGPDLGGRRFHLLPAPRVAIASQSPMSYTSFGATWHLLDHRLELPVSLIDTQTIRGIDLRKYNVLILPSSWNPSVLSAMLEDPARGRLRQWIEAGGTLIAYGGSAGLLTDAKKGLSQVRRRRDVLEELDAYEEAVARERAAADVVIDPAVIWGMPEAEGSDDDTQDDASDTAADDHDGNGESKKEGKTLKRLDEWQRRFSPDGAFVATRVDTEHWLGFGVPPQLPVLFAGSNVFMAQAAVQTAVRLEPADRLRLSGLLWPEARARMADSAFVTRESLGRGQIVLFASDPFTRGYLEGTGRVLLNAVLLGPGMGADSGVPW